MSEKRVFFRDVEVSAGWPDKIRQAQSETHYVIAGERVRRTRYGKERPTWHADRRHCHDCAVIEGEYHVPGCDVERCPVCRGQAISCLCDNEDLRHRHPSVDAVFPAPYSRHFALHDKASGDLLDTVGYDELRLLVRPLRSSKTQGDCRVDRAVLERLTAEDAAPELATLLRRALGDREVMLVRWSWYL